MGQLELDLMKKQYNEQIRTNCLLEKLLAMGEKREVVTNAKPTKTVANIKHNRPGRKRVVHE